MNSYADVPSLSDKIANHPRVWCNFSIAIGEALGVSLAVLEELNDCTCKVIDVSRRYSN